MQYCLVKDGAIQKYGVDQKNTGLGVKSPLSTYIARGWYPLEDNAPAYDSSTHRVNGISYELQVNKVVKVYDIVTIPQEELMQAAAKAAEQAVQSTINSKCVELGYDNENSIAKYLVAENPFYTECKAISLWIGAVWTYANKVQTDVLAGTRTMPTIEELVAELPKYV